MFAAAVTDELTLNVPGGPFFDIDDALDCFWDNVAGETVTKESLIIIERSSAHLTAYSLPAEALP